MTDLSIADEMAKRLVDEIRKEFDLQMVQSMIDTMMPDREKYETFYHDLYNGLIISDKMTDFTLYFLQRLLYDVKEQALKSGIVLTNKQASAILQKIKRSHDCEVGISWDVIDSHIDMFFED